MQRGSFAILAVAAAALVPLSASAQTAASPAPAGSAQPASAPSKPVRQLQYKVSVGIRSTDTSQNFGGNANFGGGATAQGTIDADVIAVDANNALLIRIAENTDNRKAPAVLVGVQDLGQVNSSPADQRNLNEEELALLGMLGRGVVNEHDLAPGSTWKVQNNIPNGTDETTYTVKSMVGDTQANIGFERVMKVTGSQPFDISTHGTMLYDFKKSIPIAASILQRVHQEGSNQSTTDLSFEYHLSKDSLTTAKT